MNVEQEKRLDSSLRSDQRRRRWSGTSRVIARAKSALITSASQSYSPFVVTTPTARRPSKRTAVTSSLSEIVAPRFVAARAIARDTAPHPPYGCQTPCSYSRNDRIENRLGQLNGDMPRYFDWNENARRSCGWLK